MMALTTLICQHRNVYRDIHLKAKEHHQTVSGGNFFPLENASELIRRKYAGHEQYIVEETFERAFFGTMSYA